MLLSVYSEIKTILRRIYLYLSGTMKMGTIHLHSNLLSFFWGGTLELPRLNPLNLVIKVLWGYLRHNLALLFGQSLSLLALMKWLGHWRLYVQPLMF